MTTCKGTVRSNMVVLEEGVHFPEGASVEVRLIGNPATSEDVFERLLANPISHFVGMDAILEEDKQEREKHSLWLRRSPFAG